jgi:hypothetical protein
MRCTGLHNLANPLYLKGFLFSALPSVALHCVPGGVKDQAADPHIILVLKIRVQTGAKLRYHGVDHLHPLEAGHADAVVAVQSPERSDNRLALGVEQATEHRLGSSCWRPVGT